MFNTWKMFLNFFLQIILPSLTIFSLLASIVIFIAYKLISEPQKKDGILLILSIGLMGLVLGIICGASRESITGLLLSGLISLLSAILAFLFSKETIKQLHPFIPYTICMMVLSILLGLSFGGTQKQYEIQRQKIIKYYEEVVIITYAEKCKTLAVTQLKSEDDTKFFEERCLSIHNVSYF